MTLKDKNRDMARSVLPSTRRKSARLDKQTVHGRVRSRVRDALKVTDDHEPYFWDEPADLHVNPQRDRRYGGIREVVRDRRAADKVSPLMRWAEAKADDFGDTPQERCSALRAILPPNLIGWHAMSHVSALGEYDTDLRWNRRNRRTPAERRAMTRRSAQSDHDRLVNALNERLADHGELNRRLKRTLDVDRSGNVIGSMRLWAGRHDTVAFVEYILRDRRSSWGSIVIEFCDLEGTF